MNPYVVPMQDIEFILKDIVDVRQVLKYAGHEEMADDEMLELIYGQAAKFAVDGMAPLDVAADKDGAVYNDGEVTTTPGFKELYNQYVEAGWHTVAVPEEIGGQGLPNLVANPIREMFVSANKAFCPCSGLTESAIEALFHAGSEELKNTYLPKLVSGEWTATMNLTEPHAGSDVGALRSRAEPQADGSYKIFGQKIFITFGEHDMADNIIHLVLARVTGAPPGSKGVSLFVVPKFFPDSGERNDVKCAGIEHKLGNHGSPTCTMVYGDSGEGATGYLVGEENKGLRAMFVMMNSARLHVGLEGVALSEKAYQIARNYAQERVQGRLVGAGPEPVTIDKHPDVRRMLLLMRSQIEAMRALSYLLSEAIDLSKFHPDKEVRMEQRGVVDLLIPIFKAGASENANEITSMAMQVWGGMGYIEESGVAQCFRDVRISAIYEGTTAIQANDFIERKVLADKGVNFGRFLGQISETVEELRALDGVDTAFLADNLEKSVDALKGAIAWAAETYASDPQKVLAGAVPLLNAAWIVAGGWMLGRSAIAAKGYLLKEEGDLGFMKRKLQTAQFYASHVLPQAFGLAETAKTVGESALLLGDEAFA